MVVNLDPFAWDATDPLAEEHRWIEELILHELSGPIRPAKEIDLSKSAPGRWILKQDKERLPGLALALIVRASFLQQYANLSYGLDDEEEPKWFASMDDEKHDKLDDLARSKEISVQILVLIARRKVQWNADHLIAFANWFAKVKFLHEGFYPVPLMNAALKSFHWHPMAAGKQGKRLEFPQHLKRRSRKGVKSLAGWFTWGCA